MTVIDFPVELAPVNSFCDLIDQGVTYVDPRTSAALRQVRSQPVWRAQLEFQELCLDKWRALSAFLAKLKGPVNAVRLWDYSDPGEDFVTAGRHFTDGTGFDDGTLFDEQAIHLVANATVGAESITVQATIVGGLDIPAGFKIGLPDDRLYIVTEATHVSETLGTVLPIRPPVSRAELALVQVKTYRPTTRFYREGADPIPRDVAKFGSVTLNFTQEPRS